MQSRHVATAKWARSAFSRNEASVGGRVQSCGDSSVFLLILFCHVEILASASELQSVIL